MSKRESTPFEDLVGETFKEINVSNELIRFIVNEQVSYELYHNSDCCENVYVEDICGDLQDLISSPILFAKEATNKDLIQANESESYTWTFYILQTAKGSVTIRFYGSSNGYYSEIAQCDRLTPDD